MVVNPHSKIPPDATAASRAIQRWLWPVLLGIGLLAFGATALFVRTIAEYLPHSEDEAAYLFQAQVLAQGRLTVPTPANPQAFWSPFVVDYQRQRFGKYPFGWPLLLSAGILLGQPWLINALLGAMTLPLIGWLGLHFYTQQSPGATALLAAGLGLVTPGFLFLSGSLLSHSASLFWGTLALLFLYKAVRTQRGFYGIAVGMLLGAMFITRPFAALSFGLAIGGFLGLLALRGQLDRWLLAAPLLGGLPIALLLPGYYWAISGDPSFNPYLLVWPYDKIGFGPDVGPHGFTPSDAIFINARLKLATLATGLFGWPGWSNLIFLPIPFLARQANKWDGLLAAIIASIVGVHLFYWAFGGVDGGLPRYYYDALPAFLLLTARGIVIAVDLLGRIFLSRWGAIAARWVVGTAIALLVSYSLIWTMPTLLDEQQGKYGITPVPLRLVEAANPPAPTLILVADVDRWSDFAASFAANSPTLDGPVVYAIEWGPGWAKRLQAQFPKRTCWRLRGNQLSQCGAE